MPDFAERCFKQIEGFSDYGFPESHAASFALLVYVSSWLKCHYPAAFAAALLNSQPMGFYKPAQIVRDARDHGVEVREVDVNDSDWDCTLEMIAVDPASPPSQPSPVKEEGEGQDGGDHFRQNTWRAPDDANTALRLGFRQIKGMREAAADCLVDAREQGYSDVAALKERAGLKRGVLERLARADGFQSLGLDRRQALWAVKGLEDQAPLPLFAHLAEHQYRPEPGVPLPVMQLGEQVADDYLALKLSLKSHPMALLRPHFDADKHLKCADLVNRPANSMVRLAGVVLIRQRPGSAKGVIFITIEDETGVANLIVWPHKMERYRRTVLGSHLLGIEGKLQREGIVTHIVAERLFDYSYRLGYLTSDEQPHPDIAQGRNIPPHLPGGTVPSPKKLVPGSRDFQ